VTEDGTEYLRKKHESAGRNPHSVGLV
jgi:hypothetical protein